MKPKFSVIVPTYRRPKMLRACIESLMNQEFPKEAYEIIVVDDAGEQEDSKCLRDSCRGVTCRLTTQEHLGAAAARNTGAAIAEGRHLAFTDDDCRPFPDWLKSFERSINRYGEESLFGGSVINGLTQNLFASASQALIDYLYDYYNKNPENAHMLTSNNLCISARLFQSSGGFNPAFTGAGGEDRELCLRWAHLGRRLIYTAEAKVLHTHDMTLHGFIRQHFAYGSGSAILRRSASASGYGPLEFEPLDFYRDLLGYPHKIAGLDNGRRMSVLFLISQAATAAGYFYRRICMPHSSTIRERAQGATNRHGGQIQS